MISRKLTQNMQDDFFKGKVIVLIGARQVGKTTEVKKIISDLGQEAQYLNGDETDIHHFFKKPSSTKLNALTNNKKVLVIDEAHQIPQIGLALKLLIDTFPDIQIVATGSSSFDIGNRVNEPLTGRKFEYQMFPFSFSELVTSNGLLEETRLLEHRLVFGSYPEVVVKQGDEVKILRELVSSYLYRDVLRLDGVLKPTLLSNILMALAFHVGSEVSLNELAQTVGSNPHTVDRYIDLLEKSFVLFRLRAFSRNIRNELKKSQKIYFFDNGVRNAVIGNYSAVHQRTDAGALWENYLMSERLKALSYQGFYGTRYFWRTLQQQEIDLIEEVDGQLFAYEFKWNSNSTKRAKIPKTFTNNYPEAKCEIITPENYVDFLLL